MRETVLQSLETGAPGLSAATRQAIARSIILKVEGRVLAPILGKADSAEAAEARADRLSAEVEALREDMHALLGAAMLFKDMDAMRPPGGVPLNEWLPAITGTRAAVRTALARAAVKAETEEAADV